MDRQPGSSFWQRPVTRLGWWAGGLAIAFWLMNVISTAVFMRLSGNPPWLRYLLISYGILMILCGLASGIIGLLALVRKQEHSWLVLMAILPGVFVIIFLLGEFLIPH